MTRPDPAVDDVAPKQPEERIFTRRHWGRELVAAWLDVTSLFRGASGKLSQVRIVLFIFAIAFVQHWPAEWNESAVWALAIIVFGLPVDALFARVPVTESLQALQAVMGAWSGRAVARTQSALGWGSPGPSYSTRFDRGGPDDGAVG